MKFMILIMCMFLLAGCNAFIGIPSDPDAKPWSGLYLFSFVSLLIIPLISVLALIVSIWKTLYFKLKLKKYLNYSVIVIGLLWILGEMSLTPSTNIRVDLFITIPAIALQIAFVVISRIVADRSKKTSNKAINADT